MGHYIHSRQPTRGAPRSRWGRLGRLGDLCLGAYGDDAWHKATTRANRNWAASLGWRVKPDNPGEVTRTPNRKSRFDGPDDPYLANSISDWQKALGFAVKDIDGTLGSRTLRAFKEAARSGSAVGQQIARTFVFPAAPAPTPIPIPPPPTPPPPAPAPALSTRTLAIAGAALLGAGAIFAMSGKGSDAPELDD